MNDPEKTFAAVAQITGITKEQLLPPGRRWPLVEARMLFVLSRRLQGATFETIARELHRSHPAIVHAHHTALDYLPKSKTFQRKHNQIKALHAAKPL